jgi:hypothetical protein
LIRKAEILDAQEDRRYGKGNLGSELPDELRHKQSRLEKIRQARKEMEAETAAAAARQRQEEAEKARAKATSAQESNASATEQAELNRKAEAAAAKAKAAKEKAIEAAETAGVDPPDLEPLAADAMPRRGLARKADGMPTNKTQRNHRFAEGSAYTDPDSHLMQSGGSNLQGYNCQLAVDSDHQVIVNGQIKEARGLRRFLLRGLDKVDGEWHLIAATHNLLKLFRFQRSQQRTWAAATG